MEACDSDGEACVCFDKQVVYRSNNNGECFIVACSSERSPLMHLLELGTLRLLVMTKGEGASHLAPMIYLCLPIVWAGRWKKFAF